MPQINPQKTIVEVRFKPILNYFRVAETLCEVAMELLASEDWVKGDDAYYVRNLERRERVAIEFHRVFYECDYQTEPTAIQRGIGFIDVLLDSLGTNKLLRVGVRQFFALSVKIGQKSLIERIHERYMPFSEFVRSSGMATKDVAITVDLQDITDPRRQGKLLIGAMEREEWTKFVPYQVDPRSHLTQSDIGQVVKSLPKNFLFLDIDKALAPLKETDYVNRKSATLFASQAQAEHHTVPIALIKGLAL